MEKIAWLLLTVVTLVAAIVAQRNPRALLVGRVALGIYYVFAGAMVHVIYLATGATYETFADSAHVSFVRDTWRSLVAPHQLFFIGLLVVVEATMGALVLIGVVGRSSAWPGSSRCRPVCCCSDGCTPCSPRSCSSRSGCCCRLRCATTGWLRPHRRDACSQVCDDSSFLERRDEQA
jgi:hypothetical protein